MYVSPEVRTTGNRQQVLTRVVEAALTAKLVGSAAGNHGISPCPEALFGRRGSFLCPADALTFPTRINLNREMADEMWSRACVDEGIDVKLL